MKTRTAVICFSLLCLTACHPGRKIKQPAATAPLKREYNAALWDFFQTNPHQVIAGNKDFLQPGSVIRGGDFKTDAAQFTAGLIDFDADGRFNEVGDDRIFLTIHKNRRVRFNNGYGTPLTPINAGADVLKVDDHFFQVVFAGEDGKRMTVEPVERPPLGAHVLKMITKIPDIELENYAGKKVRLRDLIDHKHRIYLAFWAMPTQRIEFEKYPVRFLTQIQEQYSDSVRIVSIQYTINDTPSMYQMNDDLFMQMIAQPWLSLKCDDLETYNLLHQDLSYNQGILTDKHGNFIEMYLLWKDMAENFPYMR